MFPYIYTILTRFHFLSKINFLHDLYWPNLYRTDLCLKFLNLNFFFIKIYMVIIFFLLLKDLSTVVHYLNRIVLQGLLSSS